MAFLPSNVVSFCQPTDQGITEKLKTNIGVRLFSHLQELLRKDEKLENLKQINPAHVFFFNWTAKAFERSAMAHSLKSPLGREKKTRRHNDTRNMGKKCENLFPY